MATADTKQKVLDIVNHLPPDATVEDVMERLYLLAKVERGLAQADRGETIPHNEVKKRLIGD